MQVFYEFNVLACTHFMFFSSWAVELAPTNTLVTPFCCNIQASAIRRVFRLFLLLLRSIS